MLENSFSQPQAKRYLGEDNGPLVPPTPWHILFSFPEAGESIASFL